MSARIAYLCLEAPREGQASYTHVTEIVGRLRSLGWQVDLHAPAYSGKWERPGLLLRCLYYLGLQLRLACRLAGYQVLYVRAHPLAWPLATAAALKNIPVCQEVNGTFTDLYVAHPWVRLARWPLDAMQRSQYRSASAVIGVTAQLGLWLRDEVGADGSRVHVISNGADTELFRPGATSDRELPQDYVVFVGGLTSWHGVGNMVDAAAHPAWPDGVSLVVVGDGAESARIAAATAANPRVLWLGRLAYRDVPGVIAGARAGLVPISDPSGRSRKAGLSPIKLYEVLACAVPAIVTDLPGLAEFVRENACGVVVPVDEPAALAEAVAGLVFDPAAGEMGKRGREAVATRHSWAAGGSATAEVLCAITHERPN